MFVPGGQVAISGGLGMVGGGVGMMAGKLSNNPVVRMAVGKWR